MQFTRRPRFQGAEGWLAYVEGVARRIGGYGADGIFLDFQGFPEGWKCMSRQHGYQPGDPEVFNNGCANLLRRARAAFRCAARFALTQYQSDLLWYLDDAFLSPLNDSMKLLTFVHADHDARPRIGAWLDGDIVDLAAAGGLVDRGQDAFPDSLRSLIAAGPSGLATARRCLDAAARSKVGDGIRLPRDKVRLLPPITDPNVFFCVGKNNKSHLEELVRNQLIKEIPKEPTGFVKLNSVMVGDDAAVIRPKGITTLDYEPELTFVIGRRAFRTARHDASSYIAGITLTNDLTARQVQKQEVASGTRFWTSKNMPGFGPVGPFIITLDEVADPHNLWITCCVNGEQRMRVHSGDMIFRIGEVLEHFSRWMPFEPGDLIAMGAPAGVAVGQPNADELYLRPGDVVEIAIEGFAPLRTRIVDPEEEGA